MHMNNIHVDDIGSSRVLKSLTSVLLCVKAYKIEAAGLASQCYARCVLVGKYNITPTDWLRVSKDELPLEYFASHITDVAICKIDDHVIFHILATLLDFRSIENTAVCAFVV